MRFDEEELVDFCRALVRIPSLSGEEELAADLVREKMESFGFQDIRTDRYGSVVGRIPGRGEGRTVLLDGHMDTVGVGDLTEWLHDPYGAEVENGRIYGRGASDMKGALSAMIYAVSRLADDPPAGDVYVSASVFEEKYEGVALKQILRETAADFVIIGEASNLDLKTGQKGRAEIRIKVQGTSGHAAHPGDAVNAVYKMQSVIVAVREMELPVDPYLGSGVMELTDIISSPYPGTSVIPSLCTTTWDRRLVTGETRESVLDQLESVFEDLRRRDCELRVRAELVESSDRCYTGARLSGLRVFPAWYYDDKESFAAQALEALRSIGIDASPSTYGFCTNGSASAGDLGIPTLGFGPSEENQAHVRDEYVEIDQLVRASKGYMALSRVLTSKG